MSNTPGATLVGSLIELSGDLTAKIITGVQVDVDASAFSGNLAGVTENTQAMFAAIDALVSFPGFDTLFNDYGFTDNSANWDTAYGWGDHASAGYLTDAPSDGDTYGRKNGSWEAIPAADTIYDTFIKENGSAVSDNAASDLTLDFDGGDFDLILYEGVTSISISDPLGFRSLSDPDDDVLLGFDDTDGVYKFFTIGSGLSYDHATHTLSATGAGAETDPVVGAVTGIVISDGAGNISGITDNSSDWNTAYGWGDHSAAGYLTAETNNIWTVHVRTSGAYTLTTANSIEFCNKSGSNITLTLPLASTVPGQSIIVQKYSTEATYPTVSVQGDDLFDNIVGFTSDSVTGYQQSKMYTSDGVNGWYVTNDVRVGAGLTYDRQTGIKLSHLGIESLVDPGADRIAFWDESANATAWLTVGSGLTITDTTITASVADGSITDAKMDATADVMQRSISFFFNGDGSAIAANQSATVCLPYSFHATSWDIVEISDTPISGAIKIDVWIDTYGNYPPTNDDTVTNAHEPEVAASATKAQDTNITDWGDVTWVAGSYIKCNVDSCASMKKVLLTIKGYIE